jgi:acetyltransferase
MMHCVMNGGGGMDDQVLHTFCLEDGQILWIRSLRPQDAGQLVDLFNHMGPESRFLRFNLSLPDPDPERVWSEARRMAQVDQERDGAWLVFAGLPGRPSTPVAGARYIQIGEGAAEASLAVRDDMQRKGIGTELLRFLVEQAQIAGIRQLVASAQSGNRALWRLLKRSSFPMKLESERGFTTITVNLKEPDSETVAPLNGTP